MLVLSFNYFASVVTERLLILCFYTNYLQNLWRHQLSNLHNTKLRISLEREKISEKGNNHLCSFWRAFHMCSSCFPFRRHFKYQYFARDMAYSCFSFLLFGEVFCLNLLSWGSSLDVCFYQTPQNIKNKNTVREIEPMQVIIIGFRTTTRSSRLWLHPYKAQ